MDKSAITKIFNQGFREGANHRADRGLPFSRETPPPDEIPDPPDGIGDASRQVAWTLGYATGYQAGASDTELEGAVIPAEDSMVSELSTEMLEKLGVFTKVSDEI